MTISSTVRIAGPFTGNGVTTTFPFTYKVFSAADVQVIRLTISTSVETTLTIVTDYTITLNGDQDSNPGGNIVLVAALSALYKLTATSNIANLQPTDLTNQGGFYPEVITDALDRATIQIQQMSDNVTRSIKAPLSDDLTTMDMTLPVVADRINKVLAFDATGMPIVLTQGSSITNVTIGGTLDVTGATTLSSTLGVTGQITGNVTGNLTGNAATATNVPYSGLTGTVTTWNQNTTGNAATATSATTATTAGTVTNPNLTGEVTTSGLTATVANSAVIGKVITGYTSGAGTVAATDTILQAIQKLNGNYIAGGVAAAGTLTGATLAANVLASSLTSIQGLTVGKGNSSISSNSAYGQDSLFSNTTGYESNAFGYKSLEANTTGGGNGAFGYQALKANTTGVGNNAFGQSALQNNTTAASNNAFGSLALQQNTTGLYNCAFGGLALRFNTTANSNGAFGLTALQNNTTGFQNNAFGMSALQTNTTGSNNTAMGYLAGSTLTTGSTNIFLGASATPSAITVSNEVNIYNGSVVARFQGAASAWTFVSDARDKENIENLNFGLDFVNQLQPRKFSWNMRDSDVDKDKVASGFIAQELASVVESQNADCLGLVYTNDPNQFSIAQTNLIPVLVNAIKELNAKFEAYVATHP